VEKASKLKDQYSQPPARLMFCTVFRAQKNPHKAGSFGCPCLLFASRYSFAKRSWIETVYG
ncbi:hypothetical protein, partial [uncultured Escherichia sp.]|uniref:hypothetical protein n=1 Tax=uncultured Escherichia sp. TaxID=237777 RepID=UPI002670B5DB